MATDTLERPNTTPDPQAPEPEIPNNDLSELDEKSIDELKLLLKEKTDELKKLQKKTTEKMRELNKTELNALYSNIEVQRAEQEGQPPTEQKKEPPRSNSPETTAQTVLRSIVSGAKAIKGYVNSPNETVTLEANERKISDRKAAMALGKSKVDSLCKDTNKQIDLLVNGGLNGEQTLQAFKQIKRNVTEINQDMQINLRAAQGMNGAAFDKAMKGIEKDAGHIKKLSQSLQQHSSVLNVKNALVPNEETIDFSKLTDNVRDVSKQVLDKVKLLVEKLSANKLSVG